MPTHDKISPLLPIWARLRLFGITHIALGGCPTNNPIDQANWIASDANTATTRRHTTGHRKLSWWSVHRSRRDSEARRAVQGNLISCRRQGAGGTRQAKGRGQNLDADSILRRLHREEIPPRQATRNRFAVTLVTLLAALPASAGDLGYSHDHVITDTATPSRYGRPTPLGAPPKPQRATQRPATGVSHAKQPAPPPRVTTPVVVPKTPYNKPAEAKPIKLGNVRFELPTYLPGTMQTTNLQLDTYNSLHPKDQQAVLRLTQQPTQIRVTHWRAASLIERLIALKAPGQLAHTEIVTSEAGCGAAPTEKCGRLITIQTRKGATRAQK